MDDRKFDPKKLAKLNNVQRLKDIPVEWIWKTMDLGNPDVLVDIGAGTGFFSIPFVEMTTRGKVYACDISDVMLDWIRENISPGTPAVIPLKMDETRVNLPSESADFVYMICLHHELDAPMALLKECHRLLKPDGKIAIVDWRKVEMEMGPPVEIRCDTATVEKHLLDAGFIDVHSHLDLEKHFLVGAEK